MTRGRLLAWIAFVIIGIVRPGVDRLDRWLASVCWNIPSAWNAVADVAIQTGAVSNDINGRPAPWRQASVLPAGDRRIAIVTVSDLHRSRIAFLSDRYERIGQLDRVTSDPSLVTDEIRGYKGLSHLWPFIVEGGRLQTLIAGAPTRSDPPMFGDYAYIAIGPDDVEVLFVCRLQSAPGPMWGALARNDVNHDGIPDLAFYLKAQYNDPPIATFVWNAAERRYVGTVTETARPLVNWWTTTPAARVVVPRGEPIDPTMERIAGALGRSFERH